MKDVCLGAEYKDGIFYWHVAGQGQTRYCLYAYRRNLVRGQPKLHRLVVALCEKWRSLTCHQSVSGISQTNNCTKRIIGRTKECAGLDPVSGTRLPEGTKAKRELFASTIFSLAPKEELAETQRRGAGS